VNSEKFGDEIFKLDRFNINAQSLKTSDLIDWFSAHGLNIEFLVTKGSPRANFPPDSALESFLLTFQKCMHDRNYSIKEVSNIYKNLNLDGDLKARFDDLENALREYLNSTPFKTVGGVGKEIQGLTASGIMDVFFYGEFTHDQEVYVELYNKISRNENIREFYWFEFYRTLYKCALAVFQISLLNQTVIKELRGS
jgi:hypothetical protein